MIFYFGMTLVTLFVFLLWYLILRSEKVEENLAKRKKRRPTKKHHHSNEQAIKHAS